MLHTLLEIFLCLLVIFGIILIVSLCVNTIMVVINNAHEKDNKNDFVSSAMEAYIKATPEEQEKMLDTLLKINEELDKMKKKI